MNTILNQFQDKINGTFSFFDRMIMKGHIRQLFSPSGKKHFLSYNNVLLKDFSGYAAKVTSSIVSHVETLTASLDRPLIYLSSAKTSKEQTARDVLTTNPVEEGLICTLSVVEYCSTLQPIKKQDGMLTLANVNRKCKYYYFYYVQKPGSFRGYLSLPGRARIL